MNKKRMVIGLSIYTVFIVGVALLWMHFYQNVLPKDMDINIRAIFVIVGLAVLITASHLLPKLFVPWIMKRKEEDR